MISDVLHEAVSELDHYLTDRLYDKNYAGNLRKQIVKLRDEALYLARVLDTSPDARSPSKAIALKEIGEQRKKEDAEVRRKQAEENQRPTEATSM